ncbi:hypothetical protein C1752_09745 [Acaryochloris thomasi RCC1774]|uniref:N-acetyltransferase domain-containing protein n=1 Tax=Acaryochloris thomasi RCC1774 TaxID=1764569 RepID=A0A2W1JGI5_9CYAN|nr:GNAT family N-acetyltransferase [Acaryochloris thomasi]PZD70745.1 hypothetical protein C1752_09745 [Acaryochloris thomasi RCC1774]
MDTCHFRFCDRTAAIDIQQLQLLFQLSAPWAAARCGADLEVAIANSYPVITVWEGERQIGFVRATSDGVYRAVIWDVVIHPEYQGVGLGRKLMATLLKHPHICSAERVYLMTSREQGFYEHIGFTQNLSTTMLLEHQSLEISPSQAQRDLYSVTVSA